MSDSTQGNGRHTVIGKRLEGDVLTGPYRLAAEGEAIDENYAVIIEKHNGTKEVLIPVGIYGNRVERH